MRTRLAAKDDLPRIEAMYGGIVAAMEADGLFIWDDVYPCARFDGDVAAGRLHVLEDGDLLLAAFALCEAHEGAVSATWPSGNADALYLERLGVAAGRRREGVGSAALCEALALARDEGAASLRLFVADVNEPALRLYEKNGFERAGGACDEQVADGLVLRMLGFERRTGA